MRDYGQIYSMFWTDRKMQGMSDQAKLLAAYLLTGPHTSTMGCMRLPLGYVMEDLNWCLETVKERLSELSRNGFLTHDPTANLVLIFKFLKWNPIANPNMAIKIEREFETITKDSFIFKELATVLLRYGKHFQNGFINHLETVSKHKQEQEQEQEQEQNQQPETTPPPLGEKNKKPRRRKPEIDMKTFLANCDAEGVDPIPQNDPVFAYADESKIPYEFLHVCWFEFVERHLEKNKTYQDWRAAFRNCVRGNWYKLWWFDALGFKFTTAGQQAYNKHKVKL